MPEELLDEGNALGMLRAEHETIRALLGNVYERDAAFARQALVRLLQELEIHSAMEQQYFIPLCEASVGLVTPDRMQLGTQDSMAVDELATRLESMDVTDAAFKPTMEQLIHSFKQHCYHVEENLFIALEGQDWTMHNQLVECAIKMRNLRKQLSPRMARPREKELTSFQEMQEDRAREMGRGEYPPRDVVDTNSEEGTAGV